MKPHSEAGISGGSPNNQRNDDPEVISNLTKSMKSISRSTVALTALATCALISPRVLAEEGGGGHIVPGAKSTLIDLLPTQPGWVLEAVYLNYNGNSQAGRNLPVAGLLTLGLDATSNAMTLGTIYTFEPEVFGAYYSVGAFVPYVWMDVNARIGLAGGPGPGLQSSSSENGFGDITLMPLLIAWKPNACWQIDFSVPIYAPTGDYEVGRLANPGLNHWSFDPTIAVAYANEQTGFNFASHAGFGFSTENSDTNYRNGTVFHFDMSAQQMLPLGPGFIGLGVEAFYMQQISDDGGAGATLGGFRGRSVGVGPVVSYVLPQGDNTFVAEARWLPELETKNRLEGDYFWLKLVYQF
jgi:hypothetical protein